MGPQCAERRSSPTYPRARRVRTRYGNTPIDIVGERGFPDHAPRLHRSQAASLISPPAARGARVGAAVRSSPHREPPRAAGPPHGADPSAQEGRRVVPLAERVDLFRLDRDHPGHSTRPALVGRLQGLLVRPREEATELDAGGRERAVRLHSGPSASSLMGTRRRELSRPRARWM